MRIRHLAVAPGREDHIARHNVSLDEVFEVAFGRHFSTRSGEGRYRLIGQTDAGRYLAVFIAVRGSGVYGLITARDATDAERRIYQRHGRR